MNSSKNMDIALLLLRLTFGGSMLYAHGYPKLMRFFADGPLKFADPLGVGVELSLGLAVFAEFFCALLLIIGLFTRYATIPLIITMVIAAFVIHIDDPYSKMEKALLFLVPYICLLLTGAGWYSIDEQFRKTV
jgi:putative oxidoreductase